MLKLAALALLLASALPAKSQPAANTPWLFVGFKGKGDQGVYYAVSPDGYHWTIANQDRPVFHQTQPNELMRDPFLQRGPDGTFHLVWTWSWNTPTVIGHATSTDLLHWSAHQQLNVLANEPAAINAWAPALYYDTTKNHWLLFWSSTIPGRFPGDNSGDKNLNHRIFSTTTTDFKTLTPAKLFFDPGYSVIDATLLQTGSGYTLIFKDERKTPLKKVLQTATGPTMEGPWSNISPPISEAWSEGAAIIPVAGGYLAYYDHYVRPQHYHALFSPDLKTWTDATGRISFPKKLRHGSFLPITPAEYENLNNLQQP
ncbi:MAG: glycoside hydrolase family 43 protein [Edaphobacter sp.]